MNRGCWRLSRADRVRGAIGSRRWIYCSWLRVRFQSCCKDGLALHQAGRLPEAEALYRQVLAINSRQLDAMQLLGMLLAQTGLAKSGIALLREALCIDSNQPQIHNNLANVLREAGQIGDAIWEYRKAIELQPGFAEAHNNLGLA